MAEESTTPDLTVLAQRFSAAATARDLDVVIGFFAPDGVVDTSPLGLGVFEGREAIRGLFEEWEAAYEDYKFEFEEGRDLGNGVTFAVVVRRARPRGGTGWVQFRSGIVSTWVDGLIERTTNYADIDEARAAAERLAQERG